MKCSRWPSIDAHTGLVLMLGVAKWSAYLQFTKPEKIYLNNTNLHSAYCETHNIGTLREVFVNSMLQTQHKLSIPKKGDLLVDGKYLFEIGGKSKTYKQIKNIENSYVISDDIEIGSGNKIPLWLFGFLY